MRVVSYIRVSSKGQTDGDGPDRQRDAIAAFCAAHKLTLAQEYFEAVSGTVEGLDRPAFRDLLDSDPPPDVIVVERMDRLARDLMVSELLLSECRRQGTAVYATDQGMLVDMASDGGDPTRVLIRQILGALAQWEKTSLVRKLRLSRERVRRETGHCEGKKPYGFYPGEQEIVDYVMLTVPEGTRPRWTQLAANLNIAGLYNRAGREWTRSTLWAAMHARFPKYPRQEREKRDTVEYEVAATRPDEDDEIEEMCEISQVWGPEEQEQVR